MDDVSIQNMGTGGATVKKQNSRVDGDLADIGHTCEPVLGTEIKDILDGQSSSEKVASSSVDDILPFSGGSRSPRMGGCNVSNKAEWRKTFQSSREERTTGLQRT